METDKVLRDLWRKYKWTVLLALAGLIFAVSVISYGFFKALFIFICIAAGVYIGIVLDRKSNNKRKAEDSFYHD